MRVCAAWSGFTGVARSRVSLRFPSACDPGATSVSLPAGRSENVCCSDAYDRRK